MEHCNFLAMWEKSGVESKSEFIKARVFGERFRVTTVDKTMMIYEQRLSAFYNQFKALGVNYNQALATLRAKCNEETGTIQFFRRAPDAKNVSQPQQQSLQPLQEQPNTQSHDHDQSSSFVSSDLGLFDPHSGSSADIDDIENEQMARNLKPKKKRGRRM